MNLAQALRLSQSDVVTFVGGGGKSSTMFRLAAEIVAAGGQVITTTTTRLSAAQVAQASAHVVASAAGLDAIGEALGWTGHVLVTGPVDTLADKAFGIPLEFVSELQKLPGRPTLIVEADGARRRPFKAPAEHEPPIPAETTVLVMIAGADVLGRPLTEEFVHRPTLVAGLAGARLGNPVTPEMVARVLAHLDGGLKNAPAQARIYALINKVESETDLAGARQIAQHLLAATRLSATVLAHVQQDPPVVEVWGKIAAVVLAAGQASRMGQLKQVMPWGQGDTVIGEVVQRLRRVSDLTEIVVVTGRDRAAVEACVADAVAAGSASSVPVRTVFNPKFAEAEMARSVEAGLNVLPDTIGAALVVLGDQPQLQPDVVAALVQRWRETQAPVVAPFYQGQRGNPVLLDRAIWPLVRALPDSANPRQIFQAAGRMEQVQLDDDSILRDLDTPEDYAREFARGLDV